MMIIDEVPAWDPSVRSSKRLTTTPKRLLADPSLTAALLQISPSRMLDDLETAGFLFESLVAHDLRIYAEAAGAACFHYREGEGRLEVDYVIETYDGDWIGVEVKLGESEIDKAANALHRLADRVTRKPKSLVVVTGTSLAYTRDDGVHVVPPVVGRVVQQRGDRPDLGPQRVDGRIERRNVGDVGGDKARREGAGRGQPLGQGGARLRVEVDETDTRALRGEGLDQGRTDAGCTTGDQHRAVPQGRVVGK